MVQYLSKIGISKLKGTALLRLDFNTKDDWRMKAALPTIQFLQKHADKVVILSHKGRPLGFQSQFTLKTDAEELSDLLRRPVAFLPGFNFLQLRSEIEQAKSKSVFVLENLRFMRGEAENEQMFAKNLASLGDYFVNEAFAVSHRENASVAAITSFLPSYAGLGFELEIKNLSRVMTHPKKPLVMILGGAKIEEKLGVIKYFKTKADAFLMGGALANTLLYLKGVNVGKSLIEKKTSKETKALLALASIVLPTDFRGESDMIYDIGSESEKRFVDEIKKAKTIVWNGPIGLIEKRQYMNGTLAVARATAANTKAFSVVGGGETVMALKRANLDKQISFISTGGGAMLDFLAGKKLPGIAALERKNAKRSAYRD